MRAFSRCSEFLRIVTATAVVLAPHASAKAQTPAPRTSVLTEQSVAVARLAPRRMLTAPAAALWPTEVLTAAGLEHVGLDPMQIEEIEVAIEPPLGAKLFYAGVVRFAAPFSLDQLRPELLEDFEEASFPGGRTGYRHSDPNGPSMFMANDTTLLMAAEGMLKKLERRAGKPASGVFADWLANAGANKDFHVAIHLEPLWPLIQMAAAASGDEIPPQGERVMEVMPSVRFLEAYLDMSNDQGIGLVFEAKDEAGAQRLSETIEYLRQELLEAIQEESFESVAEMDPNDPVQAAFIGYVDRVTPAYIDLFMPKQRGLRFGYEMSGAGNLPAAGMQQTAVIGVLVALLLPAVQAAREAARRNQSMNNMKELMLAAILLESQTGALPAQAIFSADGTPLLSWRVALLPFLDRGDLYERFHLDEPWDSPHNLALLPEMPELFIDPSHELVPTDGKTHYLGVSGPNAFFNGAVQGRKFCSITDGTSRSMAIVQVGDEHAVPWTKPEDFDTAKHAANPFGGIGGRHPNVFLAAFADGHIQAIPINTPPDTIRAMFTINGREPIELP